MKVAILPYIPKKNPRSETLDQERNARLITRLINYLGQIPPKSKVATDHYEEGRRLSNAIEQVIASGETFMYPWLNPGARRRPDRNQFKQLLTYMEKLDTPMLLVIIPASLAAMYAETSVEYMGLRTSFNFQANASGGVLLIDPGSTDPVRYIAV